MPANRVFPTSISGRNKLVPIYRHFRDILAAHPEKSAVHIDGITRILSTCNNCFFRAKPSNDSKVIERGLSWTLEWLRMTKAVPSRVTARSGAIFAKWPATFVEEGLLI